MAEERDPNDSIKEIPRARMFGTPLQGSNRSPQLAWSIWRGNPRITVFINGPREMTGKGIISAPMDPVTMYILLDRLMMIADGPDGVRDYITCYTTPKTDAGNGAAAPEKILLSEIHFGKDDKGIVWISLQDKEHPKIKFEYRMSDWHEIFINGQQATESVASVLRAKAAVKVLAEIYPKLIAETDMAVVTAAIASQKVKATFESFEDDVTF